MNNPNPNESRRVLALFIEFVKFVTGFVAILALALVTLNFASAAAGQ